MIVINDIFYSIQGEGYYIGTPAIFVRTQGCNLRCGFCDTKEAQEREIKNSLSQWYTSDLARKLVGMIIEHKCNYIVFTGGEPLLLRENLGDLIYLIDEEIKSQIGIYKANQLHYGIETNGSLDLAECAIKPYHWKQISICLSPKVNKGNPSYIDSSFYAHCIYEKNNFKRVSLKLLYPFYLLYGKEYTALHFDDHYVQPLVVDVEYNLFRTVEKTHSEWIDYYSLACKQLITDLNKFGSMWKLSIQLQKLLGIK